MRGCACVCEGGGSRGIWASELAWQLHRKTHFLFAQKQHTDQRRRTKHSECFRRAALAGRKSNAYIGHGDKGQLGESWTSTNSFKP